MAAFDVTTTLPANALGGTRRHTQPKQEQQNSYRSYVIYISSIFNTREEEPGGIWLTCRNMALRLTGSGASSPAVNDICEYQQFNFPAPQLKELTKVMRVQGHLTFETLWTLIFTGDTDSITCA